MGRNITLEVLRGARANLPLLAIGESYFCTDTHERFIGTASGVYRENVPAYTGTGAAVTNRHVVIDSVTLPSGGSATVTLAGAAAFSSAASYQVFVTDNVVKRTLNVVKASGSSFTVSGGGTGDVVGFFCVGT